MKKNLQKVVFFLLLCLPACNRPLEKCTISGRVIGSSSKSLALVTVLEDPRWAKIHIPIDKDSTFSYEIDASPSQAYWLIFEDDISAGRLMPVTIFPDQEKIRLILYDSNHSGQNKIYGGVLNKQYTSFKEKVNSIFYPLVKPYNDSLQILMEQDKYFSPAYKELNKKIGKTQNQDSLIVLYKSSEALGEKAFTKPVLEINRLLDSIYKERYSWCYNYYDQNQNIVSYSLLMQELMYFYNHKYSDLKRVRNLVEKFSSKYPGHPYNKTAMYRINSFDSIRIGGEFIDFTLPDLQGNSITLSTAIKGKIALIDLWATWCGPCIATSRSMIPVYNEFKNSGFTIIGVANEIDNTDKLRMTLEREKFPWLNLVEINNQNAIWAKYGIPNAAGGTFLVDKDGKILAVSPSAEEVRNILTKKLK
jgi:peroxiredoxin